DDRYIVFTSTAGNVLPGQVDNNFGAPPSSPRDGGRDVFLYDRVAKTSTLVSHAVSGARVAANGASTNPAMSADGRFVVFESYATDLVAGFVDGNGVYAPDIYLFDRLTGSTSLVSHAVGSGTSGGNDDMQDPAISADGSVVAFRSWATNLVPGFMQPPFPTQAYVNLYIYDRLAGTTLLASHAANSATTGSTDYDSHATELSDDGRYAAYDSDADNLVNGDNLLGQVYLYDRLTNKNTLVSHTATSLTTGAANNTYAFVQAISADGNFVDFTSDAADIVSGFSGAGHRQAYLFDRAGNYNTLISHAASSPTQGGNSDNYAGAVSADGRYVTFGGGGNDLVIGYGYFAMAFNEFVYD